MLRHRLVLLFIFFPLFARADYGWIPEYERLNLKLGVDFVSDSLNFVPGGGLSAIVFQGNQVDYSAFRLWLEPEYGFAQDWSALVRLGFTSNSISPVGVNGTLASGSGPSDIRLAVKWKLTSDYPLFTVEPFVKILASSTSVSSASQLVVGDGNLDLGVNVHIGFRSGRFLFAATPGLLGRFGGYSSALTFEGAVQYYFPKGFGYFRAVMTAIASLGDGLLLDSSLAVHDAPGSGGTLELLNGSPTGVAAGIKVGFFLPWDLRLEANLNHAIFGSKFPDFLSFGFDLVASFDFFAPKKTIKIHEVPLNGEQ